MDTSPLIVHVVYRLGVGGLENGVVNLMNSMCRDRWRHAVVSLTDLSPDMTARIQRPDVARIAIGKRPGHLVRHYPQLYRLFKELRPAVVHTRNLAALETVIPARCAGVPVCIHGEHGWDTHDPKGERRRYSFTRRMYRPFVDRYVALSTHLQEYLVRRVGVAREAVTQIYNGVDTERFRMPLEREPIPGCPFRRPSDWIIGWVGRMEPIKDLESLVQAFLDAAVHSPETTRRWRLVLAGDGGMREPLQRMLERAGAIDRVWFAGVREDIPAFMRGLDCFVLPSRAEGISNTVLEAMASGLPIIATAVGGNPELIASNLTGTLVRPRNSEALADALLRYYCNPQLARRHGDSARLRVERRFSLTKMVEEYTHMYEQTLLAAGIVADGPRRASVSL